MIYSKAGLVVWPTLATFGMHAGKMKFNTQNEE
jgi:hypothetical protein